MATNIRARGRVALLALFVAALVGAQLAQLSHFLLVPHEFCEHGDLVHVSAIASPASPASDDRTTQARAGSNGSSEHEHCDANAVRAELPRVVALPPAFATLTFLVDVVDRAGGDHRALGVLDVAPKVSPPRA